MAKKEDRPWIIAGLVAGTAILSLPWFVAQYGRHRVEQQEKSCLAFERELNHDLVNDNLKSVDVVCGEGPDFPKFSFKNKDGKANEGRYVIRDGYGFISTDNGDIYSMIGSDKWKKTPRREVNYY